MARPATEARYAYDNSHPSARRHLASLSAALDDFTIGRLTHLDLTGRRCLEIGAGRSHVPVWLAEHVGPTGLVTATDLDTSHTGTHPRLTPLRHDIVTEPVPDPPYDLIHARLVLMHLPEPEKILARLVDALAPGGILCVEDWHVQPAGVVLDAPSGQQRRLFAAYQHEVNQRVFQAAGSDPNWAPRIHTTMRAAGLRGVDTAIYAPVWHAGSPGLQISLTAIASHRDQLLHGGLLTDADLHEVTKLVSDPDSGLVVRGHQLYSTLGGKPHH
ncbi:methyltransferase domain-containing protein [Polymorphospora sp. NPDC050346]|uniref:class I SAM-dependent methyltransferase n=1 Tax=Polymorphospora sp. NPDC050346 TaxID=3155780 RepID=UPI0033FDD813